MKIIVWYGSLMCKESAKKSCDIYNFSYGYIKNYRRIFNRIGYNPWNNVYNFDSAMLNILPQEGEWLAVSYFWVQEDGYTKIRAREWDFDEQMVDIYNENKQYIGQGIIFVSKKEVVYNAQNISLIHTWLLPEPRYLDICLNALRNTHIYDHFIQDTYLWCGRKKLKDILE